MGNKPKKAQQYYAYTCAELLESGLTLTRTQARELLRTLCDRIELLDAEKSSVFPVKPTRGGPKSYELLIAVKLPLGVAAGSWRASDVVAEQRLRVTAVVDEKYAT